MYNLLKFFNMAKIWICFLCTILRDVIKDPNGNVSELVCDTVRVCHCVCVPRSL